MQELGRVASFEDGRLRVESTLQAAIGDSISVCGVCLTVVDGDRRTLAFDLVPETLSRSSLGQLVEGAAVNLEPALRIGDPLGGHVVQGHVDSVGRIRSVEPEGGGRRIWVDVAPEALRYCVEKGSVAVDGASLTVAALDDAGFAVALVPHTLEVTTFGSLAAGDDVNVEVDVLAKYVERLLTGYDPRR